MNLKEILKEKLMGKFPKGVLILHVNVPSRRALPIQKKLAYQGFQYLDHPPYFPELASSDYHLFPGLKKQLNVSHFSSDAYFVAAAATRFEEIITDFFEWLAKLEQRAKKCTELRGEYDEQIRCLVTVDFFLPLTYTNVFRKCIEMYVILNCVLLSVYQWDLKWALLIHEAGVERGVISKMYKLIRKFL